MAMESQYKIKIKASTDTASFNEVKKSLDEALKNLSVKIDSKETGAELKKELTQAQEQVMLFKTAFEGAFDSKLGVINLTKLNSKLKESSVDIGQVARGYQEMGQQGIQQFRQLTSTILSVNRNLDKTKTIFDKMKETMRNTINWGISSSIMNSFTGAVKKSYGYVRDLDKSLNNIRVVSNESADSMERFAIEASKSAKFLGSSTLDYTDAALIYYQQGLSGEDVTERTNATLKLANTTGESASQVSDYMTAIWNNFDDGSKSLEYYADVLARLGADTASSSDEIAEGLEKFSSVAKTVGLSYEYATSALTTITATTRQSADVVGTALKTLFSRIQDLELGDTLEDGTTLGTYSEALEKVGINIKDQNGELKKMDDILNEMGNKWNTLSKDQQVSLAQSVAGVRQYNQLMALMNNWNTGNDSDASMVNNLERAKNAAGSLNKQQSLYLESVDAQLNKLQTSWEAVYKELFDVDTIKSFASVLSDIAGLTKNIIGSLGGGKGVFMTILPIITQITSKDLTKNLSGVIANIQRATENANKLKAEMAISEAYKNVGLKDETSKKMIGMKEQVLGYGDLPSDEQNNWLDNILDTTVALQKEKEEWENVLDEIHKVQKTFTENADGIVVFDDTKENLQILQDLLNDTSETYDKDIKGMQEDLKKLNDISDQVDKGSLGLQQTFDEISGGLDVGEQYSSMVLPANALPFVSDEALNNLKNAKEEYISLRDEIVDILEKFPEMDKTEQAVLGGNLTQSFQRLIEASKKAKAEVQKNTKTMASNVKKEMDGASKNIDKKIEENENTFGKLIKSLDLSKAINSTIKLASGVGQIASAAANITKIPNIWEDQNLDTGDKILQTISAISISLVTLRSSFKGISETIGGSGSLLKDYSNWISGVVAQKKAMSAADKVAQLTSQKDILIAEARNAELAKEAATRGVNVSQLGAETVATATNNATKTVETKITQAQTAATEAQTVAQIKNNIAKMADPTKLLIVAAVALVAAITAVTVALIKNSREQQKANDLEEARSKLAEDSKVAEKAREESEAIRKLAEGYDEIYKQYQKGSASKQDLASKTTDLIDSYGDEDLKVLALAEDYETLNEKIKENQLLKNQQTIEAAQEEQKSIQSTMRADIRKNRKESEIDKDTAGVSGWSIDLKGSNGVNSKSLNKLIENLEGLGINVGKGTGHISLDDFIKVATENEDKLRQVLEASETDAAQQLISILEDESDYLEKNRTSREGMQTAQKENIGIKKVKDIAKNRTDNEEFSVEDYDKAVADMVSQALKEGLYESSEEGKEDAKKWAETYLNNISEEFKSAGNRSTLSKNISKTLQEQLKDATTITPETKLSEEQLNSDDYQEFSQAFTTNKVEEQVKSLTTALQTLSEEQLSAIAGVENYSDQLLVLWGNLGSAEAAVQAMAEAVNNMDNNGISLNQTTKKTIEQYDKNEAGVKGYIKYLQKENKALADNEELAETVAVRQIELGEALKDCVGKWDDWQNALEECDEGTADYYSTLGEMAEAFSDVFGVDLETDFIEDNLKDLEALINGDVDAFQRLQEAAAHHYVANMTIYSNDQEEIDRIKNELNSFIDEYSGMEVGTVITMDDTNLISTLNNALKAGEITETQMNKILSGIGYKGKVTYVDAPGPTTTSEISANILGKDIRLGKVKTTSTVKVPQIESLTATENSASTFTNSTVRSATQGSNSRSGSGKGKETEYNSSDDIADIYQEVNTQLQSTNDELKKIQSQTDKLTGLELIQNINAQIQNLNKNLDLTNKKLRIAQGEQQGFISQLQNYGVGLNADGSINQQSYIEAFYREQSRYTSATTEDEAAKKRWEDFKQLITDYNNSVKNIDSLKQDIQDSLDKITDLKIQAFNMEIEVTLDLDDARKQWEEFKKDVIDKIEDDDILGNTNYNLESLGRYYDEQGLGKIQEETKYLTELLNELKTMDATGSADYYDDNRKQALEDLQKYYEQTMSDLTDIEDIIDEIEKSLGETLDDISDQMQDQLKAYEQLSDTLDHDMKLIQLVFGEDSYSKLEDYYAKKEQNFNSRLDFQKQQVEFWEQQMTVLEKGSEEWEKARDNWMSAVNDWQSSIESAIENLQDKYLNAINAIFDNLNNQLTNGKGLAYINEEWELINKNADRYLDTINSQYGIQTLQQKYLDAIDETSSLAGQQKLTKLMNEQVEALKAQDKLSQADLDRADLKYQIAVKRLQLEEAQQNKSTMRLRRDSQGNYSYQYTADEDETSKLESELSNLYNQLYNFDKEQYISNLDEMYAIWEEYQQKMTEAMQINDPEQREARKLLITQQYEELINGIVRDNEKIKQELHESTFLELADLYDEDYAKYATLAEAEQEILMDQMIPQWNDGIQEMIDKFAGEGGFIPTCEDALNQLAETTEQYETDLAELQEAAAVSFKEVAKSIDPVLEKTGQLVKDNDALFSSYQKQVDAINNVLNALRNLTAQYDGARKAALNAAEASYKYWEEQQRQAQAAAAKNTASGASTSSSSSSSSSNSSSSSSSSQYSNYRLGGQSYTIRKGDTLWGIAKSRYGNGGLWSEIWNNNRGNLRSGNPNLIYPGEVIRLDTGGYTGEWNSADGKLAMLHQKELVLNAQDTENILSAVSMMRNMLSNIGSQGLGQIQSSGNALEQNVHIEASFPNVSSTYEIEAALNNLVNAATQHIHKNK